MASGLPDYQQTVRPDYGGAKNCTGSKTMVGGAENILCSIPGKGMIYGGGLSTKVGCLQEFSTIKLYIDGWLFYAVNWDILYNNQHIRATGLPIYLLKCDPNSFVYSCGISYGYTFEAAIRLTYTEGHGLAPQFYYNLLYALIT